MSEEAENSAHFANLCGSNRIVVHGERFARAVVPFSAKPFNFQVEYRLTEDQVTRRISDWSGVTFKSHKWSHHLVLGSAERLFFKSLYVYINCTWWESTNLLHMNKLGVSFWWVLLTWLNTTHRVWNSYTLQTNLKSTLGTCRHLQTPRMPEDSFSAGPTSVESLVLEPEG